MEQLRFDFDGKRRPRGEAAHTLVGVVASGNLEVMIEAAALNGRMQVVVITSAQGFANTWQAVLADFNARHPLADVLVSINDVGATPAVVSLRLDQAVEAFEQ